MLHTLFRKLCSTVCIQRAASTASAGSNPRFL
jgi:hypothetical protein